MSASKIAITIDPQLLKQLDRLVREKRFSNRSQAVQAAIIEKLDRTRKARLIEECAKLSRAEEQALAEEGIEGDAREWPGY
jgi:metal-responsive CopG/Arc/MetJ family transcriptional regulator